MGNETSTTDTFEQVLERGRRTLEKARDEYSALEGMETVPEPLAETIVELERELDELDQSLRVSEQDIELAERTVQRIAVVEDAFSALRERQRITVEADIRRLKYFLSGVAELARQYDVTGDIETLERQHSMLEKLAENERYRQIETNDRVSLGTLDTKTRQVNNTLETEIPDEASADTYLSVSDQLLDEIHDALSELGEQNDDRTAYSTDLGNTKDLLEDAREALGDGDDEQAAWTARVALEGCLSLHLLTARARARQQVANALAATVREYELDIDCDVDACVERGDAESLLTAITETVTSQVELSTSERVRQLLAEHDGSVVRTAESTDFDVSTILGQLELLYDERKITDIRVEL